MNGCGFHTNTNQENSHITITTIVIASSATQARPPTPAQPLAAMAQGKHCVSIAAVAWITVLFLTVALALGPPPLVEDATNMFNAYDTNEDGFWDDAEVRAMVANSASPGSLAYRVRFLADPTRLTTPSSRLPHVPFIRCRPVGSADLDEHG
jgi:hypothetical protein